VAPASSANLNIVGGEEAELAVTLADPPTLVHLADTQDNRTIYLGEERSNKEFLGKCGKIILKKTMTSLTRTQIGY
jgi:hypothetical protein